MGNKLELPRLLGSSPLRLGLTWALSDAGQPEPRLHELLVMLTNSRRLNKE
ncbi:MAG: hypothetical protein AAGK47_00290 [Bacteroidota bacterium]